MPSRHGSPKRLNPCKLELIELADVFTRLCANINATGLKLQAKKSLCEDTFLTLVILGFYLTWLFVSTYPGSVLVKTRLR